jgi:hypothetical protein
MHLTTTRTKQEQIFVVEGMTHAEIHHRLSADYDGTVLSQSTVYSLDLNALKWRRSSVTDAQ